MGKRWGSFATIGLAVLIMLAFVGVQQIVAVVYTGFLATAETEPLTVEQLLSAPYLLALATLASAAVCTFLVYVLVALKSSGDVGAYLALRLFRGRDMAIWLSIYVALSVLMELLSRLLDRPPVPEFMEALFRVDSGIWSLFVAVIVVAPWTEELIFRGFWFKGHAGGRWGSIIAIVLPGTAWALIHAAQYDWFDLLQVFCVALVLGGARLQSRSLLLPVLLHALNNAIASVLTWLYVNGSLPAWM